MKKFLLWRGSYASQEKLLCTQEEFAQCMESQQLIHAGSAKFRPIWLEILCLGTRVLRVDCNVRRHVRRHWRERL